jgi:Xaa-Pro dipeptidase
MRAHASAEMIDWDSLSRENTVRLQREMGKNGLDGMVIGTMNNIHWLTGIPMTSDQAYFYTHIAVLSKTGEEPVLLSPYVKDFFPEEKMWLEDVRPISFTKEIKDPTELVSWHVQVAGALKDLNISDGRVGIDPRISIPLFEGIRKELPGVELVSAGRVLSNVRSIKGEEEIKALKHSCTIAEMGLEAGMESVQVGKTEREIAGEIVKALFSSGATAVGFMPNIVAGERPGILFSSSKFVRRNELVRVDISSVWGGYYSCIARTLYTGKPDKEVLGVYRALEEAHEEGLDFIKPGITNYQLYDFTKKQIEKRTQVKYSLPFFLGHGIGVSIIDEPWIFESACCEETVLEEGMCFLFEPILHVNGYGDVALTDCVCVRKNGAELLTRADRSLFIKD